MDDLTSKLFGANRAPTYRPGDFSLAEDDLEADPGESGLPSDAQPVSLVDPETDHYQSAKDDERTTAPATTTYRVHLCFGPNCTPRGSRALLPVLEAAIARAGIGDRVEVFSTSCRDRCDYGPSMNVYPGPVLYNNLTPEAIEEIVEHHLRRHHPVSRHFFKPNLTLRR